MKLTNNFSIGIIDKDSEERYTKNGSLIHAENAMITTSDGSDGGVVRNWLGNEIRHNNNLVNGICIGSKDDSFRNRVFYFDTDDIYDYVFEYNSDTNTNTRVLQSSKNGVLNFNKNNLITHINIITSINNQDYLAWAGDHNPPRIINIEYCKTLPINGFSEIDISVMKPAPKYSPKISLFNTGENENNIKEKFISFAYRYKYRDGYYSAISKWSKYAFESSPYNLDTNSFENIGMVNAFNAVNVFFNTGGKEVIEVDLLFKESNSTVIYLIESFNKEDNNWLDNTEQSIIFSNQKSYISLSENEYYRTFDNVPLSAEAQEYANNRLIYGNFTEGRNLIDYNGDKTKIDYTVELESKDIFQNIITTLISSGVYNITGTNQTKLKSKTTLNLSNISFLNNTSLYIIFDLKNDRTPIVTFQNTFLYTITRDYTNFNDFYTNSSFKSELENAFSNIFRETSIVPKQYETPSLTPTVQFKVSNPTGSLIDILVPAIKYNFNDGVNPASFTYEFFTNETISVILSNTASRTSLKSDRSYEVAMYYEDKEGRRTTALTSKNNTLFVPIEHSDDQNIIKVKIPSTQIAPSWATNYGFAIKASKGKYETITASIFYIDGIYRWIKLDGDNKNKVKEGDVLIVKKDAITVYDTVIEVKVLELASKEANFISGNSVSGNEIKEQAGLYMKIQPNGFEIDYTESEFFESITSARTYSISPVKAPVVYSNLIVKKDSTNVDVDLPIKVGSTIELYIKNWRTDKTPSVFDKQYIAQKDYANFKEFFDNQLVNDIPLKTGVEDYTDVTVDRYNDSNVIDSNGFYKLRVNGVYANTNKGSNKGSNIELKLKIRTIDGYFIFETKGEDVISDIFYTVPDDETKRLTVNNQGQHSFNEISLVNAYNCYVQGNGIESYQIKDGFNKNFLNFDFTPTATTEEEYKQITRFADLTYSGVFEQSTGVNNLNVFNLSTANYKDDLEKKYGKIVRLFMRENDLVVIQENKWSTVYVNKNILFNDDGSSNVSASKDVLGSQQTYGGEFGISGFSNSFDCYGFNMYGCDPKRGVVLKLSNNGLFEISNQGMRDYFKKLFRNHTIKDINGTYDSFFDVYLVNIKYDDTYVTWVYSDENDGFISELKFNPESLVRLNNELFSFYQGNIYKHNISSLYNTFYGIETPTKISFNINEAPIDIKRLKSISLQSNDAWDMDIKSSMNKAVLVQDDFVKKEDIWYSYIKSDNSVIDTSLLSTQGIGEVASFTSSTITFTNEINNTISVGDEIRNPNLGLLGKVVLIQDKTITIDIPFSVSVGTFLLATKSNSIENQSILGYSFRVDMTINKNTKTELFAVQSEVDKSYQ